ncbi:glycopeptide resistance-associated protein GraF [Staphylococcus casei]|nr:glycopeptide resistance-associated protein GraF [Staphylococcus casei]WJE85599.1 glycopeptide resistance-associated protein GraF [Staphylococcus casei]
MSKEELNKQAAEKAKAAEDKLKDQQSSSNDGEEETKKNIQDTLD